MPHWMIITLLFFGNYFFFIFLFYALLLWLSIKGIKKQLPRQEILEHLIKDPSKLPKISIIIPAHNEEKIICETIKSYLKQNYPTYEIILVDDGSTDSTLDCLKNEFKLVPTKLDGENNIEIPENIETYSSDVISELKVISRPNGRKAAALNTGIHFSSGELVCIIDADTIPETDSLFKVATVFRDDPECHGVSSSIRLLNGSDLRDHTVNRGKIPTNFWAKIQLIEYIRSFFAGRLGWERLNATILISGAFSVFKKSSILEVGGFDTSSITEDLEIVIRLLKHFRTKGEKIAFHIISTPLVWTQAPEDFKSIVSQRIRWQKGLVQTFFKYKSTLFNPKLGIIGALHIPYLILIEIFAPFIEISCIGVILYGVFKGYFPMDVFIPLTFFGLGLTVLFNYLSLSVEEDYFARHNARGHIAMLVGFSLYDIFFYHHINTLCRIAGLFLALEKQQTWDPIKRIDLKE